MPICPSNIQSPPNPVTEHLLYSNVNYNLFKQFVFYKHDIDLTNCEEIKQTMIKLYQLKLHKFHHIMIYNALSQDQRHELLYRKFTQLSNRLNLYNSIDLFNGTGG